MSITLGVPNFDPGTLCLGILGMSQVRSNPFWQKTAPETLVLSRKFGDEIIYIYTYNNSKIDIISLIYLYCLWARRMGMQQKNEYIYIYIVTDNHLEHHFFSKISEPVLRTSKQLHLEHQNCSKYALRTSEKQILRTFPLIFCILRTLNTHILRTCPVTLVNLDIYTLYTHKYLGEHHT